MTAAKVMDVIARLPDCAGQAAGAVSAYTQVKWRMLQKLLKLPKVRMPRYSDTSTTTHVTKILVRH